MKLKTTLPEYINFPSLYFAMLAARIIADNSEREPYGNITPDHHGHEEGMWIPDDGPVCLRIDNYYLSCESDSLKENAPTVSTLKELSDLIEDKPLKVGNYSVEPKPNGIQVGCTFVPWETMEAILALKPKEVKSIQTTLSRAIHNPHNLGPEHFQDGWRPLFEDEIQYGPSVRGLQMWDDGTFDNKLFISGNSNSSTYRTKLTPEQLAEARRKAND